MSKTQSLTRRLKRLPNSWVFGAVWVAALLTMATAAAQNDERVGPLLDIIASLAAPAD
ncbi:hypothetical protein [Caenimonas soli]|uniref:hypothetical protein n=1 Tax=Caenimonas soli TaxID=2735555 RepID=UPI001553EF29|nr:hypothetical protein [Caenimonas soli]NPC57117.1 hypothetical protein [Caenimonas soli]